MSNLKPFFHLIGLLQLQVDSGMASSKRSWGVMLSSCMRGYDGDDISHEHIEQKNRIQELECQIFKEIVGNNFVAAQVEDVFGTNQLMPESLPLNTSCYKSRIETDRHGQDGLGLYTPEIISDDCSSVFLVVNYKM
jgi:hypothetical protein